MTDSHHSPEDQEIEPHALAVTLDLSGLSERFVPGLRGCETVAAGDIILAALELASLTSRLTYGDLEYEYEELIGPVGADLDLLLAAMGSAESCTFDVLWRAAIDITSGLFDAVQAETPRPSDEWADSASYSAPTVLMRRTTVLTLVDFYTDLLLTTEAMLPRDDATLSAMTALGSAALDTLYVERDVERGDALEHLLHDITETYAWARGYSQYLASRHHSADSV